MAMPDTFPKVGFGLGRLHHVLSPRKRERIVLGAVDAGCTHFDVAPAYGDGLCEAELGRILKGRRGDLTIATKVGIPCSALGGKSSAIYFASKIYRKIFSRSYNSEYSARDFSSSSIIRSLDDSLSRLRTEYVDYYFLHDPRVPQDSSQMAEAAGVLENLKQAGKLRHCGVSTHTQGILDLYGEGALFGDAVQFELSSRSEELLEHLGPHHQAFSFGLMRHLSQQWGQDRLNLGEALDWFWTRFPAVVPVLATNRLTEIERLRSILATRRMPAGRAVG